MAEVQIIDSLEIATMGLVSASPISVATQGFIVFITEDIIEEPTLPHFGGTGYGGPQRPTKKKKRITARVTIGDMEYIDTIEVEDLTITVKDIRIDIGTATTPHLKITVMRNDP